MRSSPPSGRPCPYDGAAFATASRTGSASSHGGLLIFRARPEREKTREDRWQAISTWLADAPRIGGCAVRPPALCSPHDHQDALGDRR